MSHFSRAMHIMQEKLRQERETQPVCRKCKTKHFVVPEEGLSCCPLDDIRYIKRFYTKKMNFPSANLVLGDDVLEFHVDPELFFFEKTFSLNVFEKVPFQMICKLVESEDVSDLYERLLALPVVKINSMTNLISLSIILDYLKLFLSYPRPVQSQMLTLRNKLVLDNLKKDGTKAKGTQFLELFLTLMNRYWVHNKELDETIGLFDWTGLFEFKKNTVKPFFKIKGKKLQIPFPFEDDSNMEYIHPYKRNLLPDNNDRGMIMNTESGLCWIDANWVSHPVPEELYCKVINGEMSAPTATTAEESCEEESPPSPVEETPPTKSQGLGHYDYVYPKFQITIPMPLSDDEAAAAAAAKAEAAAAATAAANAAAFSAGLLTEHQNDQLVKAMYIAHCIRRATEVEQQGSFTPISSNFIIPKDAETSTQSTHYLPCLPTRVDARPVTQQVYIATPQIIDARPSPRQPSQNVFVANPQIIDERPTSRTASQSVFVASPQVIDMRPTSRPASQSVFVASPQVIDARPSSRSATQSVFVASPQVVDARPTSRPSTQSVFVATPQVIDATPSSRQTPQSVYVATPQTVEAGPISREPTHPVYVASPRVIETGFISRSNMPSVHVASPQVIETGPISRSAAQSVYAAAPQVIETKPNSRSNTQSAYVAVPQVINERPISRPVYEGEPQLIEEGPISFLEDEMNATFSAQLSDAFEQFQRRILDAEMERAASTPEQETNAEENPFGNTVYIPSPMPPMLKYSKGPEDEYYSVSDNEEKKLEYLDFIERNYGKNARSAVANQLLPNSDSTENPNPDQTEPDTPEGSSSSQESRGTCDHGSIASQLEGSLKKLSLNHNAADEDLSSPKSKKIRHNVSAETLKNGSGQQDIDRKMREAMNAEALDMESLIAETLAKKLTSVFISHGVPCQLAGPLNDSKVAEKQEAPLSTATAAKPKPPPVHRMPVMKGTSYMGASTALTQTSAEWSTLNRLTTTGGKELMGVNPYPPRPLRNNRNPSPSKYAEARRAREARKAAPPKTPAPRIDSRKPVNVKIIKKLRWSRTQIANALIKRTPQQFIEMKRYFATSADDSVWAIETGVFELRNLIDEESLVKETYAEWKKRNEDLIARFKHNALHLLDNLDMELETEKAE